MKKKIIVLGIGIILIGLVVVIYNFGSEEEISGGGGSSGIDGGEILDNLIEECARVGGEWRSFSSACVDSCFYERNKEQGVACATVMTDGCDCGPERCWNGYTCEGN